MIVLHIETASVSQCCQNYEYKQIFVLISEFFLIHNTSLFHIIRWKQSFVYFINKNVLNLKYLGTALKEEIMFMRNYRRSKTVIIQLRTYKTTSS